MLVKFEEEDKKIQTEPIIDIDALSIEAGKIEAEREKEKYTPTEEELKKLEEVLLTPSDDEISDWDVTLMDGLEDEEEIPEPTITFGQAAEKPKINRLVYTKLDG
jgi:hypothetical protein